ncbi:MAG: O-antigen ligase family protein [Planctomycetota bacterium]
MPTDSRICPKNRGLVNSFSDYCLLGLVFVAPLFLGGRHPVGRLVFVALAILTACSSAFGMCLQPKQRFRGTGRELLLAAALGVLAFQLLPLSPPLLSWLSPTTSELLPLWNSGGEAPGQLGTWSTISFTPQSTRISFVMLAAYGILFMAVVQQLKDLESIERVLKFVATGAIFMAAIGLLQFLVGNGKYLWIYEHPFRDATGCVKGPFQNQNHFAHFLALGIGPLIWWFQRDFRGSGRRTTSMRFTRNRSGGGASRGNPAITVAFIALTIAGLLTFSRGGILAMFFAGVTSVGLYVYRGLLGKRSLIGVGAATFVVAAALMIYGYKPLVNEFKTFESLDKLSQAREDIWMAMSAAIADYPLLGTGAGSHREIYRAYLKPYHDFEYTHGENGYLQVLLETGVVGLSLLLCAIVTSLQWCYHAFKESTSARMTAATGAVTASLVVSMVHSLADFVWYIPACMSVTVILLACACRLAQLANGSPERQQAGPEERLTFPRPVWATVLLALTALGAVMMDTMLPPALASPHWTRYLKLSLDSEGQQLTDAETRILLRDMNEHLEGVLARHPLDARANSRLSTVNVRRFDLEQRLSINPMPLTQIREAAVASEFPSRESLEKWLSRAVGENFEYLKRARRYARRAVALCPLQGECYIQLAQLAFVEGTGAAARKKQYVEQAMRVRPHNGAVLVAAGSEAALEGDFERMLELWKRAFHRDHFVQKDLIPILADRLAPEFILSAFAPDTTAMGRIFAHYRKSDREQNAQWVGRLYAENLVQDAQSEQNTEHAAALWRKAQQVHTFLKQTDLAIRCGRAATQLKPNHFATRRRLAKQLIDAHRYAEALGEITWCLRRKPGDPELTKLQTTATRQKLENTARTKAPPQRLQR